MSLDRQVERGVFAECVRRLVRFMYKRSEYHLLTIIFELAFHFNSASIAHRERSDGKWKKMTGTPMVID